MIGFCKMCIVFYTVNLYMCIYDLFLVLLSLRHTFGFMEYMYKCVHECVCVCLYVYMIAEIRYHSPKGVPVSQ